MIQIAKCNDQTGNTLTCRVRRHTGAGSFSTLAEVILDPTFTTCETTRTVSFAANTVVSDAATYEVYCAQTAAKQSAIYNTAITWTVP